MRYLALVFLAITPFGITSANSDAEKIVVPKTMLSKDVIKATTRILKCAKKNEIAHNNIVTIIDYTLPSTEKRLWVFDLNEKKMLFHTYVSHAINTGLLNAEYFSNTRNSQSNSLGVFKTDFSYGGRYGMAVKLQGLEKTFNDNAYDRFLVVHPAWYVSEDFIEKYGRLGRSWGCPALSPELNDEIVDTIKDNSLLIAYYPSQDWLTKSDLLNCEGPILKHKIEDVKKIPTSATSKQREAIVFNDSNNNNKREKVEPIIVMSADNYKKSYNKPAPLSRMLRRQFNQTEYIALTQDELKQLDKNDLDHIDFVIAEVKNKKGYWATEFKSVKSKTEKEISLKDKNLKPTEKFIRWLGI